MRPDVCINGNPICGRLIKGPPHLINVPQVNSFVRLSVEVDAPVAGLSWISGYLPIQEQELGIFKNCSVFPGSQGVDPVLQRSERGKNNLSFCFCLPVLRRRQDGGLFQPSPYVGYPFFMFPDLGNLCSPYLPNGALGPGARPVSQPGVGWSSASLVSGS